MSFVVKELVNAARLCNIRGAVRLEKYSPSGENSTKISSCLILLHAESSTHGFWSQLRDALGHRPSEYQAVVYQAGREAFSAFVLYQGDERSASIGAFHVLKKTLHPLLAEHTVLLTHRLLDLLILPKPRDKPNSHEFVSLLEKHPHAHPDWPTVVRVLVAHCDHNSGPPTDETDDSGDSLEKAKSLDIWEFLKQAEEDASDKSLDIWEFLRQADSKDTRDRPSVPHAQLGRRESSPLMVSIAKGYLQTCLVLLVGGTDPNCTVGRESPLHMAVRLGRPLIVKALLVFGANAVAVNTTGETPLDIAQSVHTKKSSTISDTLRTYIDSWNATQLYFNNHPNKYEKRKVSDVYLLSLDGGGVRAFNSLRALSTIEARMRQLDPKCDSVFRYFDYLAGTSSGAIIVAAVAHRHEELTMDATFALVHKIMTDVFERPLGERAKRMDRYLKELYGEGAVMADIGQQQKVIIVTTLADTIPSRIHLMTSYGAGRDGHPGPRERKIWEAARASSAAPYYFPPFDGRFIDGGIMANNPTLDAMVEVMDQERKTRHHRKVGCVLSLGTGVVPAKAIHNVEVFAPGVSWKTLANLSGTISGLDSLFQLMVSQVTQSDGQEVSRARAWCESIEASYYRLSPMLHENIDPSSTSMEAHINMLFDDTLYLLNEPDKIDNIAKLLLAKKR